MVFKREKSLFLVLLMLTFFGCGKSENIESFATPRTIAEQQGEDPNLVVFKASYRFEDVDVQRPNTIPLPVLGPVLNEVGNMFANIFIVFSQDFDVEQKPTEVELPYIALDMVHSIEIKRVRVRIIPESVVESKNPLVKLYQWLTFKKAKLDFIKSIEIQVSNDDLLEENDLKLKLGRYDSAKHALSCEQKCLELQMHKDSDEKKFLNLVPIIRDQRKIYLFPKVEVRAIPKRSFKVAVEMDFEIKVKMPF